MADDPTKTESESVTEIVSNNKRRRINGNTIAPMPDRYITFLNSDHPSDIAQFRNTIAAIQITLRNRKDLNQSIPTEICAIMATMTVGERLQCGYCNDTEFVLFEKQKTELMSIKSRLSIDSKPRPIVYLKEEYPLLDRNLFFCKQCCYGSEAPKRCPLLNPQPNLPKRIILKMEFNHYNGLCRYCFADHIKTDTGNTYKPHCHHCRLPCIDECFLTCQDSKCECHNTQYCFRHSMERCEFFNCELLVHRVNRCKFCEKNVCSQHCRVFHCCGDKYYVCTTCEPLFEPAHFKCSEATDNCERSEPYCIHGMYPISQNDGACCRAYICTRIGCVECGLHCACRNCASVKRLDRNWIVCRSGVKCKATLNYVCIKGEHENVENGIISNGMRCNMCVECKRVICNECAQPLATERDGYTLSEYYSSDISYHIKKNESRQKCGVICHQCNDSK